MKIIPLEDKAAQAALKFPELARRPSDTKVYHFTQLGRERYNPLLTTDENLHFMKEGKIVDGILVPLNADYTIEVIPYRIPKDRPRF